MNAATGQSTEVPSATPSIRVATVASLDVCAVKLVDSDWVDAARAVLPTANETNRLAQWFRVLGDPTRTRLLCALLEADKLCLCDLAATIDTAETTVSHALRWLRTLAWATVSWNVVEAAVAIGAGVVARSIALVGFGLDSTVEVLSALVIIWQFRFPDADRERRALRLIATSFFALAAYITMQAAQDLARGDRPTHTPVGIALAVA